MANDFLFADWPAPAGIRAVTTMRSGPGVSAPPFDAFNQGARCGDDAEAVATNRARLAEALALPTPPRWLQQIHGTDVHTAGEPFDPTG